MDCFNEFIICLSGIIIICFTDFVIDIDMQNLMGWAFVFIIFIFLIFNIGPIFLKISKKLHLILYKFYAHKKNRLSLKYPHLLNPIFKKKDPR